MSFDDFLDFKLFITKTFMRIIYIIGAILITLGGLAMIVGGAISPYFMGASSAAGGVLGGLAMLTLGNLAWRLICEAIIVIFSIHERLVSIDNKTNPATQTTAPTTPPPPKPQTPTKKTCQNCGTEVTLQTKFCPACGQSLAG